MQQTNIAPRVWLIDASIYVFRSWYQWSNTHKDKQGRCINAALGFMAFVDDLLEKENPQHIAFAFDESLKSSHRKEILPSYKANRTSASENLRFQFSLCKRYVHAMGMVVASSDLYEGDDVLATWAKDIDKLTVVTADKDLVQLLKTKDDLWCDYTNKQELDYKRVIKKFGVRPDQVADQLALAGDKSDNIPGVPGIGIAVAAKLLRHFDTIDVMLSSTHRIGKMKFRGSVNIQHQVEAYQHQIRQYQKVTTLVTNVPYLAVDLNRREIKKSELAQLLLELGKGS